MLRLDAENLGLEVEDKRQRAERLLAKTGDGELRKVRARAGDGVAVATVQDAQALRAKVGGVVAAVGVAVVGFIVTIVVEDYILERDDCHKYL